MKRVEIPYGDEGKNIHFVFPAEPICQRVARTPRPRSSAGVARAPHLILSTDFSHPKSARLRRFSGHLYPKT